MLERLDSARVSVASAAREISRRAPHLEKLTSLAASNNAADFDRLLLGARLEVMRLDSAGHEERRNLEKRTIEAEKNLQRLQGRLENLKQAEAATRRLDEYLLRPPCIGPRLDEGFISLWPKLKPRLDGEIDAEDRPSASGRRQLFALVLPSTGAQALLGPSIEAGVRDWLSYSARKIREDLELQAWQLFNPLERVLDVECPFQAQEGIKAEILLPWDEADEDWWRAARPPDFATSYEVPRFWSQFGMTLRSNVYMLAGVLALAGISNRKAAMLVAALVLAPVLGYTVTQDIKAHARENRERAIKELRTAMTDWARERLERLKVKARDWFAFVLSGRIRPDLRRWYHETLLPRVHETERELAEARKAGTETTRALEALKLRHPEREIETFLALTRSRASKDHDENEDR